MKTEHSHSRKVFYFAIHHWNPKIGDGHKSPTIAEGFFDRCQRLKSELEGKDFLCTNHFIMADITSKYAFLIAGTIGIPEAFTSNISVWRGQLENRNGF